MKRRVFLLVLFLSLNIFSTNVLGKASKDIEIQKLKEQLENLQTKVDEIESEQKKQKKLIEVIPENKKSHVVYRENFTDVQEAAPRPHDFTMLEDYRGFIPIPDTLAMIKFNARPRLDFINDSSYPGNTNMFATSDIPVSGELDKDDGYHFSMSGQGTQISMDIRAPGTKPNPRFYYENDFSANGPYYMNYKLRHLYGQMFNVVVGQTYTVFEDADSWPDTVDYEGPNSMISARRPLLRYMQPIANHWLFSLSIEKPDVQVDTSIDPTSYSENRAPEGGFNIKWAKKERGHIQFSTIFRDISVNGLTVGKQSAFGWGLNLSASLNTYKKDAFQAQVAYGHGIFYFINDATENADAAFDSNLKLKPLPVIAVMAGYTHHWMDKLRSTASFGFVNVENEPSQTWDAYHRTYYGSLNLIWQVYKRFCVGVEGLYGYKQVKSKASGDDFRGQLSLMYSLF